MAQKVVTNLDFSRTVFNTREELQSALWKVPDLKLRYDRFWDEEVLCQMKATEYSFLSPIPPALISVRLSELSQVEIDWRMMTLRRPNTKLEEDIFTRMVQLERFKLKMSNSTRSLMTTRGQGRAGMSGASRSSGPKDDDSPDELVTDKGDASGYDFYCREVMIEEERVIDADKIMNAIAMTSNFKKEVRVGQRAERRHKRSSKTAKKEVEEGKARPSKPRVKKKDLDCQGRQQDQLNDWVEESARRTRDHSTTAPSDHEKETTEAKPKVTERLDDSRKKAKNGSNKQKRVRKKKIEKETKPET